MGISCGYSQVSPGKTFSAQRTAQRSQEAQASQVWNTVLKLATQTERTQIMPRIARIAKTKKRVADQKSFFTHSANDFRLCGMAFLIRVPFPSTTFNSALRFNQINAAASKTKTPNTTERRYKPT